MTSVINGFGYNGGNQLRVELRNLTTRVDTLTTSLNSLKELLLTLHPDKTDAINAASTTSTPQQVQEQQAPTQPPARTAAQQQALNRVRP
jgi:hypothetical protein